jgi:hypothetical protein
MASRRLLSSKGERRASALASRARPRLRPRRVATRRWPGALCLTLAALVAMPASAHDLTVDIGGSLTATSESNPRAGAATVGAFGAFDLSDDWSLLGGLSYTRDFGTRAGESSSPGSDVVAVSAGAMWLIDEHFMTLLLLTGAPPSRQRSATTIAFPDPATSARRTADILIDSSTWTLGGLWTGGWASGGGGPWGSAVDVTVGVNRFDVFQQVVLPDTPRGALLRQACATRTGGPACRLVSGASTPLLQTRLALAYTGTLLQRTDFGLEGALFLYDGDPTEVGYFSVVAAGRGGGLDLGAGVPVLPLLASVRPWVTHRLRAVTLKASYQLGAYAAGLGFNHAATLRVTWKVTGTWRLLATVIGQVDAGAAAPNPSATALLGVMAVW